MARLAAMTTKPCPKCKFPWQKDTGCKHFKCMKCQQEYCWVCMKLDPKKDECSCPFQPDGGGAPVDYAALLASLKSASVLPQMSASIAGEGGVAANALLSGTCVCGQMRTMIIVHFHKTQHILQGRVSAKFLDYNPRKMQQRVSPLDFWRLFSLTDRTFRRSAAKALTSNVTAERERLAVQINRRLAHHAFCRDVATRVRARCDAVVAASAASANAGASVAGGSSATTTAAGVLSDAQRLILQQLHAACAVLVRSFLVLGTHFH